MRDTILKERTKGEFLSHIEAAFEQDSNVDTEELVREVFKLLARRISSGEIADVKAMLPPEIRALWPVAPSEEAKVV
jgi:uncharacterized protein (DUF2267 family)